MRCCAMTHGLKEILEQGLRSFGRGLYCKKVAEDKLGDRSATTPARL
jgi:hypothetical protein